MKVALLTFHSAYNYGAVLQCYALNKAIQKLGAECEVVDYRPYYFKRMYCFQGMNDSICSLFKLWLKRVILGNILDKRKENFETFINREITLSKNSFENSDEMTADRLEYDIFIVGSDQVWSPTCAKFDKVYFLDFQAATLKKKYSYAASFGDLTINEELYDEYVSRLKGFAAFSVREESGAAIIKKILRRDSIISCDPTLLLEPEEWRMKNSITLYERYVLLYYVESTELIRNVAMELGKKEECKVICVTSNMHWKELLGVENSKYGFETYNFGSPSDFLALVKNALYVVTSSFHGTVFSIIFHKEFYVQVELEKGKVNTRVLDLLKRFNLENRIISSDKIERREKIDWESIDKIRNDLKQEGIDYLREVLQA